MKSSSQTLMLHRIEHGLSFETITTLARKSGFLKRVRKVTPQAFLQACCLIALSNICSLTTWAITLGGLIQATITKQAMAKRLNTACVRFLRQSLFAALASTSQLQTQIELGTFRSFRRVLLQDSTTLALPARLAAVFPGSGNQHHRQTAALKIQTTYDALHEQFVHFALTRFTRNDQAASGDILDIARPGDLVLRDLGYFVLGVFAQLNARGVWFLSRYRYGTHVYRPDGTPRDLIKALRQHGSLDETVLLGQRERLPVRLVAIPIPNEVAQARRRALLHNRNGSVNPSADHLALLNWEMFITTVPPETWTANMVGAVYGVRWRIEIIFKTWKQHIHLPHFTNASSIHIEILLLAKLLCISLFQVYIFRSWALAVAQQTPRVLSLLKVTQFLTSHFWLMLVTLSRPDGIQQLEAQIMTHCTYDRRTRLNYHEMFTSLF